MSSLTKLFEKFNFTKSNSQTLRKELERILNDVTLDHSSISLEERTLIKNILKIHSIKVIDLMVPRADIEAVEEDIPLSKLLKTFSEAGHSRLPVYSDTLDTPLGMIHIRDYLSYLSKQAEKSVKDRNKVALKPGEKLYDLGQIDLSKTLAHARLIRPLLFVPPSMLALDLFLKMQASRLHMALVVDEYGGTDGLISLEDLVETIVGDIEDEHDEEGEYTIIATAKGYIADARVPLEDVERVMSCSFKETEDDKLLSILEDVDTLGGLIVAIAGRVPSRGELIEGPFGMVFEVTDADARRLKRLRIKNKE